MNSAVSVLGVSDGFCFEVNVRTSGVIKQIFADVLNKYDKR